MIKLSAYSTSMIYKDKLMAVHHQLTAGVIVNILLTLIFYSTRLSTNRFTKSKNVNKRLKVLNR